MPAGALALGKTEHRSLSKSERFSPEVFILKSPRGDHLIKWKSLVLNPRTSVPGVSPLFPYDLTAAD